MSERQAYDTPGTHDNTAFIPAHAAAAATEEVPVFEAPVDCKIERVKIVPAAGVTGQDTNTTHINLINKGSDGSGATELANYDLTSGNNLTGSDAYTLYAPASPLALVQGTVLAVELEKVGTGLLVPSLLVVVEFAPN